MILHNRPFKLDGFHYDDGDSGVEIYLEEKCDCTKDSIGECVYCKGGGWKPTLSGEILLQFVASNLRHILPNIETLAKFLDVFKVDHRHPQCHNNNKDCVFK